MLVEASTIIAADAGEVWSALTDPARLEQWWPDVHLDPRAGGQLTEVWTDHDGSQKTTHGEILEVRPQALIVLRWADEGWSAATDVAVTLQPAPPSGTLVTVRESGWDRLPDGDRLAAEHRQGWQMHLDHLREHIT